MDISSNGSQYACYTLGGVTEKTPHHYQTRKGVTQTENMLNVPESFFFFFEPLCVQVLMLSLKRETFVCPSKQDESTWKNSDLQMASL